MSIDMESMSNEQLDELARESSPEAQEAIERLKQQRESLQEDMARIRERSQSGAKSSGTTTATRGTRGAQPRDRHVRAAEAANQDAAKVQRWRALLDRATDAQSGEVAITPEFIQFAIGLYYAQRKRDVAARQPEAEPVTQEQKNGENDLSQSE